MCKLKKKTCEEIWHVKISRMLTVSIGFRDVTPNKRFSGGFAGDPIMPQIHCYVVLYIRLWMCALQVPLGLRAVGWIFLQHQYLQCWQLIAAPVCLKRLWPAELFIMSIPHGHWHRCSTGARCGEAQLTMWMSDSSFLRGVRILKFCFKKWK